MTRKFLGVAGQIKLAEFTRAEYVKSGKTDSQFAAFAREQLGFEKLSHEQLRRVREALGIPATTRVEPSTIMERLATIEKALTLAGLLPLEGTQK